MISSVEEWDIFKFGILSLVVERWQSVGEVCLFIDVWREDPDGTASGAWQSMTIHDW